MKKPIVLMSTVFIAMCGIVALTACETIEGAGRDIEHAGESVQDAADKN